MWNNMLLWVALSLAACSKKSVSGNAITPPVAGDTEQYGTPFAQVPDATDAVIYQVNMRAFSKQANFKGVQNRLDSIRALGINVIYLMPVYPIGTIKSVNSPYCVMDYTAVNSELGTLDDLRTLVQEAHIRNMAVIVDWVANHTSWDNRWIANKSWYQQDGAGNIISPAGTGWNDVAALNYNNADMRLAMIKALKYWVYKANIDGYRCDAADYVPATFWKQAIDSLRNITTHKLLLFAEGGRSDLFSSGFQLRYGMGFYYNLANNVFAKNAAVTTLDSANTADYANATAINRVVHYTSNHDVSNADGTPLDVFNGKQGAMAAFIATTYMPSVPMMYNGQEVGCPVKLNYFNTSTAIDWTINADITATYKKVLAYRNSSDAVKKGTYASYANKDVAAFIRAYNGKQVGVMVNLRNETITYAVPAAFSGGSWKDAFSGVAVAFSGTVTLAPYEYKLVQNQ